jgi:hypothetical protein
MFECGMVDREIAMKGITDRKNGLKIRKKWSPVEITTGFSASIKY